jgi:hypothetical protein
MSKIEIIDAVSDKGSETMTVVTTVQSEAVVKLDGKTIYVPYTWESHYIDSCDDESCHFKEIDEDGVEDEDENEVVLTNEEVEEIGNAIEEAMM